MTQFSKEYLVFRYKLLHYLKESIEINGLVYSDLRFGSPDFVGIWNQLTGHQKLVVMTLLLPTELTGQLAQTQGLLTCFWSDLAPHDEFWLSVARTVDQSFTGMSLSQKGAIERKIHQLRYLFSSQQAQYVRDHHRQFGMSDADALSDYLKGKDFDWLASARLHNKRSYHKGKLSFPDGIRSYNIKILIAFHTEFILSSQGNFLNECDAEKLSESGIINGASFNYANQNNHRHKELDVSPAAIHDPDYRKKQLANYCSPSKKEYVSHLGSYGHHCRSSYFWVRKASKAFAKTVL